MIQLAGQALMAEVMRPAISYDPVVIWSTENLVRGDFQIKRAVSRRETMANQENGCKPCPEGQVKRDGRCVMPEVTFAALIMSLNTSVLYHLGEISDPATGEKKRDMVLAKHSIDTLVMLEEKTRGNLTGEEKDLLATILYELKMRFVKAQE